MKAHGHIGISPEEFFKCIRAAQGMLSKCSTEPLAAPVDVERIAGTLGFQVVKVFSATDGFSGLVSPKHKLIGVNGNHHPHRRRFTVAHEVGHILLDHPPESRCTTKEIKDFNREADICASELLIPTQLIAPHLLESRTTAVGTLSRLFDVSEKAMSLKIQNINTFLSAPK